MTKILYVCRLFSGLEESINNKKWNPTGVPTIYRVINKLKYHNDKFKLVLTVKDSYSKLRENKSMTLDIPDFMLPVTVLKGTNHNNNFRVAKNMYREIIQFLNILRIFLVFKPQIVYIDNSNIWTAGLLARLTKIPVIFRVMGVYQYMHNTMNTNKPSIIQRLLIWLYKSPFKLVITTQDGSGVETWLKRAINPNIKKEILLNGIPSDVTDDPIFPFKKNITYITFLGKLEYTKGATEFVNAMIKVLKNIKDDKVMVNIIGFGSLRDNLISLIKKENLLKKFRFIERLPNKSILPILKNTDIYVSLNRAGNISNANLEAISAGCCIIIPKSKKNYGIDVFTDKMLPENAVCRIESSDDVEGLVKEILSLISNKYRIDKKKKLIRVIGKSLKTWDQRIKHEIKILDRLIKD